VDAEPDENMITAQANGAVDLYYNNASKLTTTSTGIDVTGTVTADGLTVGANSPVMKTINSAAGSTASPTYATLAFNAYDDSSRAAIRGLDKSTENSGSAIDLQVKNTSGTLSTRMLIDGSGDVSLFEDTGTTAKFFWDASAESLGIGTSSPDVLLDVENSTAPKVRVGDGVRHVELRGGSTTQNPAVGTYYAGDLTFATDSTERMRISSAGNVGIGTTSPSSKLHLSSASSTAQTITSVGTNVYSSLSFLNTTTGYGYDVGFGGSASIAPNSFYVYGGSSASVKMLIDSSGNVGIGTSSPFGRLSVNVSAGAPATSGNMTNGLTVHNTDGGRAIQLGVNESGAYTYLQSAYVNNANVAQPIAFFTGASERMRLDASGNLGIGTSSPSAPLEVNGTYGEIRSTNGTVTSQWYQDTGTGSGVLGTVTNNAQVFRTHTVERMRLDTSGNLFVGKTANSASTAGTVLGLTGSGYNESVSGDASGSLAIWYLNRQSSDGTAIEFRRAVGTVGSISVTPSGTTYNTTSDQRLKENIIHAPAGNIDDIKVRSFDWKADGSHQDYGMVAQELEAVAPYAVTKGATEDDMWSVDYSKLVPMLIKEIQDLKAEVAALKGAN
jgi:uncharacterized protein YaiE (UPF0345 family)